MLDALLSPTGAVIGLVWINFISFAAFGLDKIRAEARRWRVSEDTLLMLALFGGSIGAYAGRKVFRHKTRKQPFSNQLHFIASLQLVACAFAATWFLAPSG